MCHGGNVPEAGTGGKRCAEAFSGRVRQVFAPPLGGNMLRIVFVVVALVAAVAAFADGVPAESPAKPVAAAAAPAAPVDVAAPPAAAPAPAAGPRTYTLSNRSNVYIQVWKDGVAAAVAHDHVVEAHEISGTIIGDIADLTASKVDVTVKTASLTTDDSKSRARFKLEGEVPEKDIAAVLKNMKASDQLDVEKFPTVRFVSKSVSKDGDKLVLIGDFTLHGVTKEIKVPVTFSMKDADTVEGKGSFSIQTPDYGIEPYSALFGAIKNKPGITIHLRLVGKA
jgi:polyisoprenoid-binding protein YceI